MLTVATTPAEIKEARQKWPQYCRLVIALTLEFRQDTDVLDMLNAAQYIRGRWTCSFYAMVNEQHKVPTSTTLGLSVLMAFAEKAAAAYTIVDTMGEKACAELCTIPYPPQWRATQRVLAPGFMPATQHWLFFGGDMYYTNTRAGKKANWAAIEDIVVDAGMGPAEMCIQHDCTIRQSIDLLTSAFHRLGLGLDTRTLGTTNVDGSLFP